MNVVSLFVGVLTIFIALITNCVIHMNNDNIIRNTCSRYIYIIIIR